jgi:predicted DNA-binding protein (MmcQ/YjbR family)
MTFGAFYDFCLNLCGEDATTPFDKHTIVFKKKGKIFALTNSNDFQFVNLKCDPEKSIDLRERHHGIIPGYHTNKKHWNSVYINDDVEDVLFYKLIEDSYNLVQKGYKH